MKLSEIMQPAQKKINNVKPFVKPEKKAEPAEVKEKTETQEQPPVNNGNASAVEAKPKKTKAAKPGNGSDKQEKVPKISEAQKSALFNLSRRRGFSVEDIETRVKEKYNVTVDDLTSVNAGEFIRYLQQAS